jgi:hypothetical protein
MKRLLFGMLLLLPGTISAQEKHDEQFYRPGSFNWKFLQVYPDAARLFNAFDYGHAVLYETLWSRPGAPVSMLERERYAYLTENLLRRPPRFGVVEAAVAPEYARLAWRAMLVFDRAHVLHRQIYDVYADEKLDDSSRIALVERLTDWYLADREYALTATPKAMELMDGQPFSQVFRRGYPRFNGLIWAYHWLQVGLYEPLIEGRSPAERKAGVESTVARFWAMLDSAPSHLPSVMPMTSAVAPAFAGRHLRAAIIFDNLHMLHDIISDILVSDRIPRGEKRAAIYAALREFQDDQHNTMELEHWRMMGEHMGGVEKMGGRAGVVH